MISDAKLDTALGWLAKNAEAAAKARAERVYLDEWLPALRAQKAAAFMEAGDSASAADIKAKASPEYAEALTGYREAVEKDERFRWDRTRADALIEIWRSEQATRRTMEKVT
jgi:predicted NAD-dependent protein-ADP-ribosyltransferase YbiA (DUF1768 family)